MSDKIGLVVLGLVMGTLVWPRGACAQGTEVPSVTPGERISFPQPVSRSWRDPEWHRSSGNGSDSAGRRAGHGADGVDASPHRDDLVRRRR